MKFDIGNCRRNCRDALALVINLTNIYDFSYENSCAFFSRNCCLRRPPELMTHEKKYTGLILFRLD